MRPSFMRAVLFNKIAVAKKNGVTLVTVRCAYAEASAQA